MKIEYKVRAVTRYIVTRYEEGDDTAGSEQCGEFDNESEALKVGFALAKMDFHEYHGLAEVKFPDFPEKWEYYPERHKSDCAVHNEPAYPAGPCDCK